MRVQKLLTATVSLVALSLGACTYDAHDHSSKTTTVATAPVVRVVKVAEKQKDHTDFINSANAGECFGKVKIAGKSKVVTEKILVNPESTKINIVPATYKNITEEVVVKDESIELIQIPATYETVTERVIVKPASKVWKQGRGVIERVGDNGEIMCLVEEPAQYKTITKKVLVTPARVEQKIIPAVTRSISRRVVDVEAKSVERTIPAVYSTFRRTEPISVDKYEWKPLLCDVNLSKNIIKDIQQALITKGYSIGSARVDGVFGRDTARAMDKYQKALGIESSGVTIQALKSLGVNY